ncbi:unnamed protein product [Urochloa humidicola]
MAFRFAERLGLGGSLAGNVAWSANDAVTSETTVPATRIFDRLKSSLRTPSIEEVEQALNALELAAAEDVVIPLGADASADLQGLAWEDDDPPAGPADVGLSGPVLQEAEPVQENVVAPGPDGGGDELFAGLGEQVPTQEDSTWAVYGDDDRDGKPASEDHHDRDRNNPTKTTGTQAARPTPTVDDLFTTPAAPVLQRQPTRAPRQRRKFDMKAGDELELPIEKVLQDYIKSIKGPLPEFIIAALCTLLDLEDEEANQMTEALLQHAGDGVNELQAEQDALLGHAA